MNREQVIEIMNLHAELRYCVGISKNFNITRSVKNQLQIVSPEELVQKYIGEFKEFEGNTGIEIVKKNSKNPKFVKIYNEILIRD